MNKTTDTTTAVTEKTITLDEAIKRGDTHITSVSLRKPNSGELRGINLVELMNLNVNALQEVLPRITTPALTKHEVGSLDPADLVELGAEVVGFLAKKADRAGFRA